MKLNGKIFASLQLPGISGAAVFFSHNIKTELGRQNIAKLFFVFFFHLADPREVYRDSNPVMTLSTGGAKGSLDHRFRAPPAYTTQLCINTERARQQPV